MEMERTTLQERFEQMGDEELLRRYHSGDMTTLALDVAAAELKARGHSLNVEAAADTEPSEPMQEGDVLCLTRLASPIDADILCARLNAEGIMTVAADANLVRVNPLLTQALGGIRVMVREADLASARVILQALHRGDFALSEDDEPQTQP